MVSNNIIFKSHEYFLTENISFLDIGARWGLQRPWDQYPNKYLQYYGFEADKDECKRLNGLSKNHNIKFIQAVLSCDNSNKNLYITREPGRSSLFMPNKKIIDQFYDSEGFDIVDEVKVFTTTLNSVLEKQLVNPDFIKLDVQGSELNIIKGANNYYNTILGFEIEVEFIEMYNGQPLFSEVDEYMRSIGFELYDLSRYWAKRKSMALEFSNRGQVLFCDAIYLRSLNSFYNLNYSDGKIFTGQLIKFINVLVLYGFFDAAIQLLEDERCPLDQVKQEWLINKIKNYCKIHILQRKIFNSRIAQRLGIVFHCFGRVLSYQTKTSGWGTDYSSIDERYGYHIPNSIVKLFGRK